MKTKPWSLMLLYTWLLLFSFLPMLLVLVVSVLSRDSNSLVSLPLTADNYANLFTGDFARIVLRSLLMALVSTALCVLIAYPFSYLVIKSRYRSLLMLLIIIPFWTSSLIRTYALIAILKYKGIINALLLKWHLIDAPLSLLYNNLAVVFGLVYNLFPFMVLPIVSNMERFDFRLLDAARDLGANRRAQFTRVFLPVTAPGLISGCILVFLPAMTLFYIPNVLGGARSILLGNLIQNQFLVLEDWPQGAATSAVLSVLLLLLLWCYRGQKRKERV